MERNLEKTAGPGLNRFIGFFDKTGTNTEECGPVRSDNPSQKEGLGPH
jgi:hypothetical protein